MTLNTDQRVKALIGKLVASSISEGECAEMQALSAEAARRMRPVWKGKR